MSGDPYLDPDERAQAHFNHLHHGNLVDRLQKQSQSSWEHLAHSLQTDNLRLTRKNQNLETEVERLKDVEQNLREEKEQLLRDLDEQSGQYDQALSIIRGLAVRGAAFRKTILHLRERWVQAETPPDEDSIMNDVKQTAIDMHDDPSQMQRIDETFFRNKGLPTEKEKRIRRRPKT